MNSPDRFPSDDWMDARIEAYLDAELPAGARVRFERRLGRSAVWQQRVAQARRLQHALRTLPAPACPERVTRRVLSEAAPSRRASRAERARHWAKRQARAFGPPALAMSMLVALVLSAALLGRTPASPDGPADTPPSEQITEREVEQATAEVKWTLAYLAHVGKKAGASAQKAMLEVPIVRPLHQALEPVLGNRHSSQPPSSLQNHDELPF